MEGAWLGWAELMEEGPSTGGAGPGHRKETKQISLTGGFVGRQYVKSTRRTWRTDCCCARPSVRLLPWWILGKRRRRGADGGLEQSQGTKEGQLRTEDQDWVRQAH